MKTLSTLERIQKHIEKCENTSKSVKNATDFTIINGEKLYYCCNTNIISDIFVTSKSEELSDAEKVFVALSIFYIDVDKITDFRKAVTFMTYILEKNSTFTI